jgi:hypothetical protein
MREATERALLAEPSFTSVDGRAEATALADQSVDLVFAAQALRDTPLTSAFTRSSVEFSTRTL